MIKYTVFHRTWYKRSKNGLVPHAGRKTIIARHQTLESAQSICKVWNANNPPGKLSRKAEFESEG